MKLAPQQKINGTTEIRTELIDETTTNGKPLILLVEDNADVVA